MIGVEYVLRNLRDRDEEEFNEYGLDVPRAVRFFEGAVLGEVFAHDTWPAAVLAFHAVTPKTVQVSMMATEAWPHVVRQVLAWSKRARLHLLHLGFVRAECRTMEGHADAIRLLEHLGFKLECALPQYGATGKTFFQYAWRIQDHVSRHTKDAGRTDRADEGRRVLSGQQGASAHGGGQGSDVDDCVVADAD